jgi:hypothetical protein
MFSLKIVPTFLDKSQKLYTRRTRQSYTILYIINCLSDSTHGQTIETCQQGALYIGGDICTDSRKAGYHGFLIFVISYIGSLRLAASSSVGTV